MLKLLQNLPHRLTTGALGHNGPVCLQFYYYMYGAEMASEDALMLYLCHDPHCDNPQVVWSEAGDQGAEWKQFRQTVEGFSPETSVRT